MASNQRTLTQVFGISAGQTADVGRKVTQSQAPVKSTTSNYDLAAQQRSAMLTVPTVIAIGVLLWLALHYD